MSLDGITDYKVRKVKYISLWLSLVVWPLRIRISWKIASELITHDKFQNAASTVLIARGIAENLESQQVALHGSLQIFTADYLFINFIFYPFKLSIYCEISF